MKYTYIDIGTSDFLTSIDSLKDDETALMVEPLFYYLAKLPDHPKVVKAPFAISDFCGYSHVYYTTEEDIQKFKLPYWARGCNSFNKPHPDISMQFPFVPQQIRVVPVIDIPTLISVYNIEQVSNIKIDTEGHDHVIVNQLIPLIDKLKITAISFEYKAVFANGPQLDIAIKKLNQLGFEGIQNSDDYQMKKI